MALPPKMTHNQELISALPDFVAYARAPRAEHTESWNTDPQAYDSELTAFLTQVVHVQG